MKNLLYIFIALFFICGCSRSIIAEHESDRSKYSLLNRPDALMPLTSNVLANFSLYKDYYRDPQNLLSRLENIFLNEPRSDYLAALADVSGKIGERYKSDSDKAVRFHLSALLYSYCYFALENQENQQYNPNAVLLLRIYNNSLTELFSYLKERNLLNKNGYELTAAAGQKITFTAPEILASIPVKRVKDILLCADFENKNLINNSRRFGIGVPLIAQLDNESSPDGSRFAENQTLPLTALLAFDNADDGTFSRCKANLIFADPRERDNVTMSNRTIPLEYDFSTPLAYMAEKPLKFNSLFYTLNPGKTKSQEGLYYFEPVNPDKIPVIMVHGLMSDTKTWMQMLNTLFSDPDIRNNYQFWGVSYSSGNPIFQSAKLMRNALAAEREKLVKQGMSTKKFDRMILVGHSMGGLISRLATSSSSLEECRKLLPVTDNRRRVFEKLSEEDKKEVISLLDFKPLPFVKRVVFISVPHRGSALASTSIGKFGARCVRLPATLIKRQHEIFENLLKTGTVKEEIPVMTGIDNLAPDNFAITLLNTLEMNKNIPYHSIIGNRSGNGIPGGSDGIVPYSSSHIDNVSSELVVKSGHSAQQNPLAIQELRRILLLHLKDYPDAKVSKPLELKVKRISGFSENKNVQKTKE